MKRRLSFPLTSGVKASKLEDLIFTNEVQKVRKAMLDEKYKDNCYTDVKESAAAIATRTAGKHFRKKKLVNRRT